MKGRRSEGRGGGLYSGGRGVGWGCQVTRNRKWGNGRVGISEIGVFEGWVNLGEGGEIYQCGNVREVGKGVQVYFS